MGARLLVALIALAACGDDGFELEELVVTGADGEQHDVRVWVADSAEERRRGLMGVTDLGDAAGMLFVFETEGVFHVFMWQTPMPLDIAFFAADGTFVSSASMEPCLQPPKEACPHYAPIAPSLLALELPSGGITQFGLAPGASLTRR